MNGHEAFMWLRPEIPELEDFPVIFPKRARTLLVVHPLATFWYRLSNSAVFSNRI